MRAPQPDLTELLTVADDEPFILHPGEFVLGQTHEWVELPDDLVARLEGKSSLGRLGLLIHSTAGYVDPGWKGNLTLELSNVANLPIALYYGMRIGQISFFKMSSAGRSAVRLAGAGVQVPGPVGADGVRVPSRLRRRARDRGTDRGSPMAMNDAVDWSRDLGGGTRVALVQAGTFRSDAGDLFGPVPWVLWGGLVTDEVDDKRRLLQALNCLLIETPSGRVVVETGIGERLDDKTRAMRSYEGPWIASVLETAGFMPESVNIVAMSHLHFDHAGGPPPRRWLAHVPAGEDRRPACRMGGCARRQPAARGVVRPARAEARRDWGQQGWADGEQEIMPGVSVVPTGGHSAGHQAIVVRGSGDGARTLAFFGDLMMRPWAANPRWVTAFDDFPLDSVVQKAELFGQAADEDWIVVLSHESRHPIGRLVRDRDRFRYEPD